MPLLRDGEPVADEWVVLADDAPLPADGPAILSLARIRQDSEALAGRNAPFGILVPNTVRPEEIADLLDRVALVAVPFPKFGDGRGFTVARALRERFAFAGEIRAIGDILPDQYQLLLRAGFTTVEAANGDLDHWRRARDRFHIAFQEGVTEDPVLSLPRRRIALARG